MSHRRAAGHGEGDQPHDGRRRPVLWQLRPCAARHPRRRRTGQQRRAWRHTGPGALWQHAAPKPGPGRSRLGWGRRGAAVAVCHAAAEGGCEGGGVREEGGRGVGRVHALARRTHPPRPAPLTVWLAVLPAGVLGSYGPPPEPRGATGDGGDDGGCTCTCRCRCSRLHCTAGSSSTHQLQIGACVRFNARSSPGWRIMRWHAAASPSFPANQSR